MKNILKQNCTYTANPRAPLVYSWFVTGCESWTQDPELYLTRSHDNHGVGTRARSYMIGGTVQVSRLSSRDSDHECVQAEVIAVTATIVNLRRLSTF